MNWNIVMKKTVQGMLEGALAALGAGVVIGKPGWSPVIITAIVVGALRGAHNAVKHI